MSLEAHTGATNTWERKVTNNKNDLNTRGFDLVCFFVHRKKQSYKELFFVTFYFIYSSASSPERLFCSGNVSQKLASTVSMESSATARTAASKVTIVCLIK
jgi:hypothetical protein